MTSLPLTPAKGFYRSNVPEWGTDKPPENVPLWSAKSPTWHLSGKPIEQYYDLTQLKRSNVRSNDQLLPKPQESTLGDQMIQQPFPAEHPYASHVPRLKLFPSFANTAEETKRGVAALQSQPLTSETPASNYDTLIVHKTKGSGDRHEIQFVPPESLKRGLSWHGETGFPHMAKTNGGRQDYYPTPTSLFVPNLLAREGTAHAISDQAANATRNLERQQWKTTYERNHTGIGPSNQYKLDNLADKEEHRVTHGTSDDDIYPWFTNTYEAARPQEGRIAATQNPNYGVPGSRGAAADLDSSYVRKPTLTEVEEHRLLYGKEYANLPSPEEGKNVQWKEWTDMHDPEERFRALIEKQMRDAPNPMPFIERGNEQLQAKENSYLDNLSKRQHDKIQQMEAENRWQTLEALKPAHSIDVLKRKESICTPKEEVSAFYGHEGKYNEERAGLYKTSYDPEKLAFKLDSDPSKLNIRNNVNSAQDSIHYPTDLNLHADIIRSHSHTDTRRVPMFSERPDVFEVFEPFQRDRYIRLQQLQPNVTNARDRVQEGGVVLTDSTMSSGYNTKKFLQENSLSSFARSEPLALMSTANQNLANVRINSTSKQVKFDNQVTVGEGAGSTPLLVSKAHIETPKLVLHTPRPYTGTSANKGGAPREMGSADYLSMERSSTTFRPSSPNKSNGNAKPDYLASLTDNEKIMLGKRGRAPEMKNLFDSKSSNLGIGATSYDTFKSTYSRDNQFRSPATAVDLRYSWEPGCGTPRPQTSLINLQNGFSKTEVHKNLREKFPESNPNLIDNIARGRKHTFGSLNAQVLRGTLINA